jgi:tetratricopeptide (TPR) repeat protein
VASKPSLFLAELKQRKVIRALVAYGAAVFAILQGADLLFAVLLLPDMAFTLLALACLAGFPIVAALSWLYDLTVHGLHRASDIPHEVKRQRVPLKRYLELVGAFTVAGILIFLTAGAVGRLNYPTSSDDGRVGLAIFPFRTLGAVGPEWAEGSADLLATALDGTSGLRVVDPWPLWRPLRGQADAPALAPDVSVAERLTVDAGAHRFLLGSVVPSGGRVEATVRLYQIGRSEPIDAFTINASVDGVSEAVREAAVHVLARVWGPLRPVGIPQELDFDATQSPEALRAFLAAKEAMRRGQFDSANASIDRALSHDSTFVLALVEATSIKSWVAWSQGAPFQGLISLLARTEAYEATLNERTRLRLQAAQASVRTDGRTAISSARRILEIDPLDYNANRNLGYYQLAYGWQLGPPPPGSLEAGLEAAERVVLMDSTQVPALVARASWAVSVGDTADQRVQLQRLRRVVDTSAMAKAWVLALEALLATDEEFENLLLALPTSSLEIVALVRTLRVANQTRYEDFLGGLVTHQDPTFATWARSEKIRLNVARGRLREADAAIGSRPSPATTSLVAQRLFIAADLAGVGDEEIARRAVAELTSRVSPDSALAYFGTLEVWLDGWLVGAWNAQFGDTLLARRWIQAIGTLPPGGSSKDYRGSLNADIEGRLAARKGGLSDALDHARTAFDLWTIHTENEYESSPEPGMRLNLALLYREAGMADSARAVFSSLVPPTTWMGFLTARASFELGEIAYAAGWADDAARHYLVAARLWEGGGPSVASFRERALARLEILHPQ